MGLTREQLRRFRGATVPDLLAPDLRLLFVGINPSLWTAAVGAHFARPGNRFYPALYRAGITARRIDARAGYQPADLAHLQERGLGITNLVAAATARADELSGQQLAEGARALIERVHHLRPTVVAILGVTAYRAAFGRPRAQIGRQSERLGDIPLWVAPNPSGLNAHARLPELATAYREIAAAAGLRLEPAPLDGG